MWGDTPEDQEDERLFHAQQWDELARMAKDPPVDDVDAWLHLAVPYLLRQVGVHHRLHAEAWKEYHRD